jgi:16S rRNA (cytosine1402-N4)-methyltransferase
MQTVHKAVLLKEVVSNLADASILKQKNNEVWYLDGTLGGAGHALAMAKQFEGRLNIIAFDRDLEAIEKAKKHLDKECKKVIYINDNFSTLDKALEENRIDGVDIALFDLGLSSDELDNSGRGFTFQKDEPLLMTMGNPHSYPFTAKDIVNKWDEEVIANILFGYSQERFAYRIARMIVNYRKKKTIETTHELAEIIKNSVPGFYRRGKIHPATKSFQALRIAVNDELNSLKNALDKIFKDLKKGGRLAIISFHSLEDKIVKDFFRNQKDSKLITKKPIVATDEEINQNPRARSAKLRIIEK